MLRQWDDLAKQADLADAAARPLRRPRGRAALAARRRR